MVSYLHHLAEPSANTSLPPAGVLLPEFRWGGVSSHVLCPPAMKGGFPSSDPQEFPRTRQSAARHQNDRALASFTGLYAVCVAAPVFQAHLGMPPKYE